MNEKEKGGQFSSVDTDSEAPALNKKQEHYAILRMAGKSVKEAAAMSGYHEKHAYKKLEKKVERWSLKQPEMKKLAYKAIKNILKMQPVEVGEGRKMFPTFTNQLAASQAIADRTEPAVKRIESANVSYCEVNLDAFKFKPKEGENAEAVTDK